MVGESGIRQHFEQKLRRQLRLTRRCRPLPTLQQAALDVAHDRLGDARIGDPIHPALVQRLLVISGQIPPRLDDLVILAGHEVENILLQIGARTRNRVHLTRPYHPSE